MTPFPTKPDDRLTYGETYGAAMAITDQADAAQYFAALVAWHLRCWPKDNRAEAERIERSSLGYYAGYYSEETRARVERLFACAHPIFGSIAANGPPTTEEALAAGPELGRKLPAPPANSGEARR